MPELIADQLSMTYELPQGDQVEALKNVSFSLDSGDMVTVLGPSGCGKTTLLNILAGFLAPTGGSVKFDGKEVLGPAPQRGMVFQQGALFEWMTVAENVGFGPTMASKKESSLFDWMSVKDNVGFGPKMAGEDEKTIDELVDHWLDIVGLSGFAQKATYELSGGMQQRVALARCLANKPDLILMDEPLGALDALTREKMQGLILKIWKETGKSIVLITHSVEEALILGHRLFIMAPRPGRLEKVYQLPFAEQGLKSQTRQIKKQAKFVEIREEVLAMIWGMEEEIMGAQEEV